MRFDEYQALPGVNWSRLKLLQRSPLHYRAGLSEDRDAFRTGRALHSMILGGQRVVCFDGTRRGKAWDEFQVEHADATILTTKEGETIYGMVDAFRAHETCRSIIAQMSAAESPLTWQDTNTRGKALLDIALDTSGTYQGGIVDVKTCQDATPRAFGRTIVSYGYDMQLAWYARGWRKTHGEWPHTCAIVAVEKAAPYAIGVYRIPLDVIRDRQERIDSLLSLLWDCTLGGRWPGPTVGIEDAMLPAWAMPGADEDGNVGLTVGDQTIAT